MRLPTIILCRIAPLAVLIPLAACSTTDEPNMRPSIMPTFAPVRPPVDAALADPCISAAASKYYLTENHITAIDAEPIGGGINQVRLKADIRDAMCTVTDKGKVRSVVDTMPKSADQVAAEEAAAAKKAAGQPAAEPKPKKKS
ncbi:hypothetical protein [Phyllobacterium sp. YR531]|uniref:hypothetical protein n=1 Tax=Phyllobacterium sp. YR531 TaxID=1144343 RepID=UPI00026F7EAD|nr:hypothetical protein [Phyllobacterium sp. YR531]EJN01697.1 hypothetical protein PMI41_03413 [Phyllobacterium sp. YR531]